MQETSNTTNRQKNIIAPIIILVIIVLFVVWKIFFSNNNINIEASQTNLDTTLADHSHFLLKKGSVLTLTKDFNKKDRTVSLFGEAYCEINGDNKLPFIIEGGAAQITSGTTTFDVKSDSSFTVINIKGKLDIVTKNKEKLSLNIAEGEKIYVDAQRTSKELNRSDNYLFWKTGEMVFISKPLETVVADMNLYADAHLTLSEKTSDNLRQTIVNISFRNQTLDDMVKELCTVAGVKSVKKNGGWLLKGKH
jgi:ferric-dicitrate binding protein FerR (iron transport regulator)